jgi:hypothetical protein
LWPITCRRVSAVSCFDARMTLNDLHALSVGPLISKVLVEQAVIRQALDTTASFSSFASIRLAPLYHARTLSLYSALFCLAQPAPVPGRNHCYEADSEADLEPVACEHQAGAGN